MKVRRIIWLLLSVTLVALACLLFLRPRAGAPSEQALNDSALPAEPFVPETMVHVVESPVPAEVPKEPVQSLEERGDAMLFEAAVLVGTPFDQPAVMPFESSSRDD